MVNTCLYINFIWHIITNSNTWSHNKLTTSYHLTSTIANIQMLTYTFVILKFPNKLIAYLREWVWFSYTNWDEERDLFIKFVICFLVEACSVINYFAWNFSLIKWKSIFLCLVLECRTRFFAKWLAFILS